MVETGGYNINNKRRRDNSFKSFNYALMQFLAILIMISLVLYFLRSRESGSGDLDSKGDERLDSEFLKGKTNTQNENEKLTTTIKVKPKISSLTNKKPKLIKVVQTTDENTTIDESSNATDYSRTTTYDSFTDKPSSELNYIDSTTPRSTTIERITTLDPTTTLRVTVAVTTTDKKADLIVDQTTDERTIIDDYSTAIDDYSTATDHPITITDDSSTATHHPSTTTDDSINDEPSLELNNVLEEYDPIITKD